MEIHEDTVRPQALYVYAHPESVSLNRQLFKAARTELERTHTVVVSDLYAMGFEPLLGPSDVAAERNTYGSFLVRWLAAQHGGTLPDEVRAEQQKLVDADLIVLQFPLWWYDVPAILKGWIDRVFGAGFGTDGVNKETGLPTRYGAGLLTGKRALVVVTVGEDERTMGPRGLSGDLDSVLFGLRHGTLFYSGIDPYETHAVFDADGLDADGVAREVARLTERIAGLESEEPVRYRALASGEYHGTRALRSDLAPGRADLGIHRSDVG